MIFVTGGTGMVGSHLLYDLISGGESVRALKRKQSSLTTTRRIFSYYTSDYEYLINKIEWVNGDILDFYTLWEYLEDVDIIYHGSALVSFSSRDRKHLYQTNVVGTSNIVNAARDRNIQKICFLSSIASLGEFGEGKVINESAPMKNEFLKLRSDYSKTKFQAELEIWRGISEGLDTVIVNPSVILGPGDWNKGSPRFFKSVWNGMHFYTHGKSGFVDVRDVTEAMIKLTNSNIHNDRFILNSENLSYKELFDTIAGALGTNRPKIRAAPFWTEVAWRVEAVFTFLQGKRPQLTKETARNAHSQKAYTNKKVQDTLDFQFKPVRKSVNEISKMFLSDTEKE